MKQKRILSLMLVLALCLSLAVPAFAAGEVSEEPAEPAGGTSSETDASTDSNTVQPAEEKTETSSDAEPVEEQENAAPTGDGNPTESPAGTDSTSSDTADPESKTEDVVKQEPEKEPEKEPEVKQEPVAKAMSEEDQARNKKMLALEGEYYEGRSCTNTGFTYEWPAGVYADRTVLMGGGCMALAMIMSDAAYGKMAKAVKITNVKMSNIHVGDILRTDNDTHSVAILEIYDDYVVLVEGNYNSSVHWGRIMTKAEVEASDYILTRSTEMVSETASTGEEKATSVSITSESTPTTVEPEKKPDSTTPATTTPAATAPARDTASTEQVEKDTSMSAWARDEAVKAAGLNLIPKDIASNFKSQITREDFCRLAVTLVEKKTGKPVADYIAEQGKKVTANFSDTKNEDILAANTLGIVNGRGGGVFDPNGSITRREAAAMLMRTGKLLGKEAGTGKDFVDLEGTPAWAAEAISYISSLTTPKGGKAVMGGVGNSQFSPLGTYTREQGVVTMCRLFESIGE